MAEKDYTNKVIDAAAKTAGIDISEYDRKELAMGMAVEMEHGTQDPQTNITNDEPVATLKIVIAHLKELKDYYTKLKQVEAKKLNESKRFKELAGIKENEIKKTIHNEQFISNDKILEEVSKKEAKSIIKESCAENPDFEIHEFESKKTEKKEEDKELYSINESEDYLDLEFLG